MCAFSLIITMVEYSKITESSNSQLEKLSISTGYAFLLTERTEILATQYSLRK